MRTKTLWMIVALLLVNISAVLAHEPKGWRTKPDNNTNNNVNYREVCANSTSQIDQDINNVRARLLGGGDCWWDLKEGRYIVPKVDPATGAREVSALYAGSVWIGGVDPSGALKLACQTYRNDGRNDFWPGPLRDDDGTTERAICANWNQHFRVTGEDIRTHLRNLAEGNLNKDAIPRGLRGWPAQENPYFIDVWGFKLPFSVQGLAGFYDADKNGLYDPLKGDYPSIEIRDCELDQYPDEMIFWIYNDQGGGAPHARTNGRPIQMEVQVQSFGYTTNDELNDMTFQRYKLINRATTDIDSCFFAMWVDPDLGCAYDDYIGCDTSRSLMIVYNQDAEDGQPGSSCDQGTATYGTRVPVLGVDYFRGPLKPVGDSLVELGMSSFTYYNNSTPPPQADPSQDIEYYRYITGSWRDGSPFTAGGSGYGGTQRVKYAFPDEPSNAAGWSMCTANLPQGDRRTLQASGPFKLTPGALNELIIGVPFVADIDYPCPSYQDIFRADQFAQGLFDACFELLDGPTAPDMDWIEVNREVIAVLENGPTSNNVNESYAQVDPVAPRTLPERQRSYLFEGYVIYQLLSPNVAPADYDDLEKARPVYQVDVKNGISKIYNWKESRNPNKPAELVYSPELQVEGGDAGVRKTFSVKEDRFAPGNDKSLINHKKYYYSVIAYAHNNYETFDPLKRPISGQQRPYLAGRLNIKVYTVIPRPVVDQALFSSYGDGPIITRLEGAGTGGTFLDMDQATRDKILNLGPDSTLSYLPGKGPIKVTVFNPFELKDGTYEVQLLDNDITDNVLDKSARWELRQLPNGTVIKSARSLDTLNEQVVAEYGFSVTIGQTKEPGDTSLAVRDGTNGVIGAEYEYADKNQQWLAGQPDQPEGFFDYIRTGKLEEDDDINDDGIRLDPNQRLSTIGNGWFVPFNMVNWRWKGTSTPTAPLYIGPGWQDRNQLLNSVYGAKTVDAYRRQLIGNLPNVDIVMTSDKSKWSRCIVIETAPYFFYGTEFANVNGAQDAAFRTESPAPNRIRRSFDLRYALSVGKDDNNNDGLPDVDGAVEPAEIFDVTQGKKIPNTRAGQPIYGMGWFPGYAVDVETGRRLNIFFGENSCYDKSIDPNYTGRDMLWNPTTQNFVQGATTIPRAFPMGGYHWVYVTYSSYDECEQLRRRFSPEWQSNAEVAKIAGGTQFPTTNIRDVAWAGMLTLPPNSTFKMKSLKDGLIPNDVRIKLRMDNAYQPWFNEADGGKKTGYPKYQFKFENKQSQPLKGEMVNNALDSIKMVPNPYYGYSPYEVNQFSNIVKITNLPAGECTVTIYSLDGKFIRQYKRNEVYAPYDQITPAIEWDLKNNKGIPVASGVYLIHVNSPELGQRTLKWFGIARQFDPSGL